MSPCNVYKLQYFTFIGRNLQYTRRTRVFATSYVINNNDDNVLVFNNPLPDNQLYHYYTVPG